MQKSCCGGKAAPVEKSFSEKAAQYRPLIVITAVSLFMAAALAAGHAVPFMRGIMGMFLFLIATQKLFNWRGFAESFAGYDLIAERSRGYAAAYPLIELGLAWLYLSGFQPAATNIAMIAIMLTGSLGVVRVIQSGAQRRCACVGSGFDLPVGRVTLAENAIMAAMAMIALAHPMP